VRENLADIGDVRRIALGFPETSEGPSHGTPGFRVRKKLFCRLWEGYEVLVVKTAPGHAEALIATEPDIYFITPHYAGYDYVLVRIGAVPLEDLESLLADAWSLAAPKKLRNAARAS
jgi:hypothetical protein